MPTYVYACDDHEHPVTEVVHRMTEITTIPCQVCGKSMHRVPQVFRWGRNPFDTLCHTLEDDYIKRNAERKRILNANRIN